MHKLPTYLSRRPVSAMVVVLVDEREKELAACLPAEHTLADGWLRFPAGHWESYFVEGKEYNYDGTRSLETQRALIAKDLAEEGFEEKDITHFIDQIPVKDGYPMFLEVEASLRWLKAHPEYERTAFEVLSEARQALNAEINPEMKSFKR